MTEPATEPFFKGSTGRNTRGLLRLTILCLIAAAAVASRLFSVIRTYPYLKDRNNFYEHEQYPPPRKTPYPYNA